MGYFLLILKNQSLINMASVVQRIVKEKLKNENGSLVKPPSWLPTNVSYETIMGSMAYGVSSDSSDMDIYGFCIPPKSTVFPHLAGEIFGFGRQIQRFECWHHHALQDPAALAGKGRMYDL